MVEIGVVIGVVGGVFGWWCVVIGVVGVVVEGIREIKGVVVDEVGELLSVGDGVGGIAGSAHFCPYVGVVFVLFAGG